MRFVQGTPVVTFECELLLGDGGDLAEEQPARCHIEHGEEVHEVVNVALYAVRHSCTQCLVFYRKQSRITPTPKVTGAPPFPT